MNLPHLKSHYINKKGYIFTYDIIIAVFVFIIIITASSFYSSTSNENKLANVQIKNIGSDALNILVKTEAMDKLDENGIKNELETIIPKKYDMTLEIITNTGEELSITKEIPSHVFIASGKRYLVTTNNKIVKVEYKIWQKE